MNKKAGYRPVAEKLSKPPNKHLMQGSLASPSSSQTTTIKKSPSRMSNQANPSKTDHIQGVSKPNVKHKIICHSPQVVLSNIANSPSIKVERIPIDVPPTIFVTSGDKSGNSCHGDSGIYNSGNIAGSPFDLSSTAKAVHVNSDSFDKEPFPDTIGHEKKTHKPLIKQHPIKGLSKEVSAPTNKNPVEKRKKPMVKIVPSRYKAAAKSFNLAHNNSNASTTLRSSTSITSHKPRATKPLHHATPKSKTRQEKIMAKASTPSAGFKTFFDSDMSQIAPYKPNEEKAPSPERGSSKSKNDDDDRVTQLDLDLAHCEYLRICHLESTLKQTRSKKTRKALADISLLCTANAQLHKEVADLEEEVLTLEHQEELNRLLDAQISVLGPAINKLSVTADKYKELAINIDATRHGLPLNGVVVPDEKKLDKVLNRHKEILGELSTLIYTHVDVCADAAEKFRKLDETVSEENSQLNDVEELAKSVTSLAVKNTTLELQLESEENPVKLD
uniref:HAUS augmin-like complex subunit 8 n=1 Tax=Phallusia mammillata TaxID=59560 RepID=A0A6F9DF69_9ASCI|nr:HAUS augmin-like complex subunit 8 [Phallusia mammillata]